MRHERGYGWNPQDLPLKFFKHLSSTHLGHAARILGFLSEHQQVVSGPWTQRMIYSRQWLRIITQMFFSAVVKQFGFSYSLSKTLILQQSSAYLTSNFINLFINRFILDLEHHLQVWWLRRAKGAGPAAIQVRVRNFMEFLKAPGAKGGRQHAATLDKVLHYTGLISSFSTAARGQLGSFQVICHMRVQGGNPHPELDHFGNASNLRGSLHGSICLGYPVIDNHQPVTNPASSCLSRFLSWLTRQKARAVRAAARAAARAAKAVSQKAKATRL